MFDVELAGDDADAMAAEDDVLAQGPQGAVRDELLKGARIVSAEITATSGTQLLGRAA